MADRGKQVKNTIDTSFRIGSMTKSVTATAVLMLGPQQGPVRTGDSVCAYLKQCPEKWNAVRIEHLLTHTAGMPDIVKFPDFMEFRRKPHTPAQLVEKVASRPLDFAPGSKFVYSNSNFLVLGAVIERVSTMPYEAFLRKNIFGPAGMKHSGYLDSAAAKLAKGYVRDGSEFREADGSETSVRFSAGGLYSSARDLLRFVQALATGRLLTIAVTDEMWTDHGNEYGFGWFVNNEKQRREVGHNGRVDGYSSSFRYFRDEDLFLVVLSNTEGTNTERMMQALSAIMHAESFKMPREHRFVQVKPDILEQYAGKYKLPWGLVLVVTREGDRLMGRAEQEKKSTEWKAESDTKFYVPPADIEIEFNKDASGKYILNFDGAAEAVRVEP